MGNIPRNKGPVRGVVCAFTLAGFLFNIFAYDLAWAAESGRGSSLAIETPFDEEELDDELSDDEFEQEVEEVRRREEGVAPRTGEPARGTAGAASISVGEEKALRTSALSLLELFGKMGYGEFLHSKDRNIKNLKVVNVDKDALPYPEGANVAIAMEMNGGMQGASPSSAVRHKNHSFLAFSPLLFTSLLVNP